MAGSDKQNKYGPLLIGPALSFLLCNSALAQYGLVPSDQPAADQEQAEAVEESTPAPLVAEPVAEAAPMTSGEIAAMQPEINPDESAANLNNMQQLRQTVTLKRTVNGELVESEERAVTFDPTAPYRPTEAGASTYEALRQAFDGEVLSRIEAFEEAKLDFALADIDRDGRMSKNEFADLVASWEDSVERTAQSSEPETVRSDQYEAFMDELDPTAAQTRAHMQAATKFSFMAGAAETMSRRDYIREYMLDFDSMDADKDALLDGEDLVRFRAACRGKAVNQ